MDFGDRRSICGSSGNDEFWLNVFLRIPFHPGIFIFWAFCDNCSSFLTGNTIWAHDRKISRLTCYMTRMRKDMRSIWHACDKTNLTEHLINRKLTQRIYFMITGIGQNFDEKIKALCE